MYLLTIIEKAYYQKEHNNVVIKDVNKKKIKPYLQEAEKTEATPLPPFTQKITKANNSWAGFSKKYIFWKIRHNHNFLLKKIKFVT